MKIVFIGGTGRCGTNLTKAILAKHSKVYATPFEWRFLTDPDGIIDFYTSLSQIWSPYLADRKLKRLENLLCDLCCGEGNRYQDWSMGKIIPNLASKAMWLIAELREFLFQGSWYGQPVNEDEMYYMPPERKDDFISIFRRFLQDTIQAVLAENNAEVFVEDGTWNVLFLPQIYELLPEAKVIHVIRNPLDTVLDMSQQTWCPSDLVQCAKWYKGIMNTILEQPFDLEPLKIRFEDVVTNPCNSAERLCDFANIAYEPAMIDIEFKTDQIGVWDKAERENEEVYILAGAVKYMLKDIISQLGYKSISILECYRRNASVEDHPLYVKSVHGFSEEGDSR